MTQDLVVRFWPALLGCLEPNPESAAIDDAFGCFPVSPFDGHVHTNSGRSVRRCVVVDALHGVPDWAMSRRQMNAAAAVYMCLFGPVPTSVRSRAAE